jgi:hypothetical protein
LYYTRKGRVVKKLSLITAIATLIATPAFAGSTPPLHPNQQNVVVVSFETSHAPKTIISSRLVPASLINGTAIQAGASFNAHQAQACWADSVQQFECAWRGVIVIVQMHRHAAPVIVRVASARHDKVRVRLTLAW